MEELSTWRDLLSGITRDARDRQKLAEALSINPITITRWITQKSQPRPDTLRALPNALPQYREQLIALLTKEYPHLFSEKATGSATTELTIPSTFYAYALSSYANSLPILRTSSLCTIIIQQILAQFDPQNAGLGIFIAQCVPPSPGQKVRSLRALMGRGNIQFFTDIEHQTQFFGAESQAGLATASAHPIIIQNETERARMFPTQKSFMPGSSAAFPILQYDCIAGCLCIASTRPDHFSPQRQELTQQYVNLLSLAFAPTEFYNLSHIELRCMPPRPLQMPLLSTLQQRIRQQLIQAARENRTITRIEAEQEALQQLEAELFHLSLSQQPVSSQ